MRSPLLVTAERVPSEAVESPVSPHASFRLPVPQSRAQRQVALGHPVWYASCLRAALCLASPASAKVQKG